MLFCQSPQFWCLSPVCIACVWLLQQVFKKPLLGIMGLLGHQCIILDGICGYNNIITKLCAMLWYSKSYPGAKLTRRFWMRKKPVFVQYSKTVGRYITLCFTSTYIIGVGFYIEVSSLHFFDEEEHKFFWWFILCFIRHFHLHCMSHTP
jgi:hypothetical protein